MIGNIERRGRIVWGDAGRPYPMDIPKTELAKIKNELARKARSPYKPLLDRLSRVSGRLMQVDDMVHREGHFLVTRADIQSTIQLFTEIYNLITEDTHLIYDGIFLRIDTPSPGLLEKLNLIKEGKLAELGGLESLYVGLTKTEKRRHWPGLLKQLRKERGLKLKDLAEKTGYSAVAISYWERGLRDTTEKSLGALAEALDVPVDSLRWPGVSED